MELKEQIARHIKKEIKEIGNPNKLIFSNDSQLKVHKFTNLDEDISLLFSVLECPIEEESLRRIGKTFFLNAEKIVHLDIKELPQSIETLSTNFEPFLKFIAFLKYGKTEFWHGSGDSAGLSKTTLHNLTQGIITNKYGLDNPAPEIILPEPLVVYTGLKAANMDFLRSKLRNAVHNAHEYSHVQICHFSNIVFSCYLFVIESNRSLLRALFKPEYQYLSQIIQNTELKKIDQMYIPLFGSEEYPMNTEDEYLEEIMDLNLLYKDRKFVNEFDLENFNDKDEIHFESIQAVLNNYNYVQIIGEPGAGKTTTLKKVFYDNSKKILNGDTEIKIPILISANEYSPVSTLKNLIEIKSGNWANRLFEQGKLQIFIDGLNEIKDSYKNEAYDEINEWLNNNTDNSIVLSERKIGFTKRFKNKVKVYELKGLNNDQIEGFVKNFINEDSVLIWKQLLDNDTLMKMATSPLMLSMILTVCKQTKKIPELRAVLFEIFLDAVLKREGTKKGVVDIHLKKEILSSVAYNMRSIGSVNLSEEKFKSIIETKLNELKENLPLLKVKDELIDSLIINIDDNENVSFLHESYQDYYTAIELKKQFEVFSKLSIDIFDENWFESIIFCSEIIKADNRALDFFNFLYVGERKNNPKPFSEFDETDFNQNINLACKVAYNLKKDKPYIYKIAERNLSNLLIIFQYILKKNGKQIYNPTEIFNAVSSLNSPKLTAALMLKPFWIQFWLFTEIHDGNNLLSDNKQDTKKNELEIICFKALIDNTPNFGRLFGLTNIVLASSYSLNSSILFRLNRFKKKLLSSQTEMALTSYFNKTGDFEVLFEILKQNVNFIKKYNFRENSIIQNIEVLKILYTSHVKHEIAQQTLLKELRESHYPDDIVHTILERAFYNLEFYFAVLEMFIDSPKILSRNINRLQSISYQELPNQFKLLFDSSPSFEVPFKKINVDQLQISPELSHFFCLNQIVSVNDEFAIKIKELKTFNTYSINLIIKKIDFAHFESNSKKNIQGEVKLFNEKNEQITLISNEIEIISKDENYINILFETQIDLDDLAFIKSKCTSFSTLQFEHVILVELIFIKKDFTTKQIICFENNEYHDKNISNLFPDFFPDFGLLKCNSIIELQDYKSYHPDLIIKKPVLINTIRKNIHLKPWIDFVKNIGLTYYFHDLIEDTVYAILLNKTHHFMVLENLKDHSHLKLSNHLNSNISENNLESIIVLEKNNRVTSIQDWALHLNKIGFKQSKVIEINESTHEGFILTKTKSTYAEKDFYFLLKSCNENLKINDEVLFLPCTNNTINFSNRPMARKIHKLSSEMSCVIKTINVKNTNPITVEGTASDIINDQCLFFNISSYSLNMLQKKPEDLINCRFNYTIIDEFENKPIIQLTLD